MIRQMTTSTPPASSVQLIEVPPELAGQRIDNFLVNVLKGVPKTLIYRILRKGEVRVNKGRIKPEYKIQAGDIVRVPPVRLPERDEPVPVAQGLLQRLEAAIVYEDKALIVLNKPAGIAVHGGSGLSFGVIEAFRQLRPDAKELELVHRLDRDTSGLLMIAKKRSMLRHLHTMLRGDGVDKRYITCTPCCAVMAWTSATWRWSVAIGRPARSRSMHRCSRATCVPASAWSRSMTKARRR